MLHHFSRIMPSSDRHCRIRSACKVDDKFLWSLIRFTSGMVRAGWGGSCRWGGQSIRFIPFPIQPLPSNKGERGHTQTQLQALFCVEGWGGEGHMTADKEKKNKTETTHISTPTHFHFPFFLFFFIFFNTAVLALPCLCTMWNCIPPFFFVLKST